MTYYDAPNSFVDRSTNQHRGTYMQNPSQYAHKNNISWIMKGRSDDADLIRAVFTGQTQKEISEKAGKKLGVSPRTVINWLQKEHDMPSWAVKATNLYLSKLDARARRIAGE